MMVGDMLRMSFEAAFAPLEEGETRLGNFREAFVKQLQMMAAQLLATAAAALVLATILSVAFGGANAAGKRNVRKERNGLWRFVRWYYSDKWAAALDLMAAESMAIETLLRYLENYLVQIYCYQTSVLEDNRNRLSGIGG
jgi:hypothetical protein